MKRHRFLIVLAILLLATVAAAGVVKKTFDDCEKEGLQHSWIYSVPDDRSGRFMVISTSNVITWIGTDAPPTYSEISDNNAAVNQYEKTIRSRKCRNCNVVEELHVKHTEEWRRKEVRP